MSIDTNKMLPIKESTYRHYKGNFYKVICVTTDCETGEKAVAYQCLSTGTYYSRSLESFMEKVEGVPRFSLYFNSLLKDKGNDEYTTQEILDFLHKIAENASIGIPESQG